MCGILGIASALGGEPSLTDQQVARLLDMLAHRGPDGAGLCRRRNVVLAHRRLIVIDPSPEASQPMTLADDGGIWCPSPGSKTRHPLPEGEGARFALVYNGELYNDAELRRELSSLGHRFRTRSDTETVLRAFAQWGTAALSRLRGMFALALHDARLNLLTLARDPLGVKPLYYFVGVHDVMFASEPGPLVRYPEAPARPNMRMASAYLTTIRTTLAGETMFEGIRVLPPGCMLQCDLAAGGGVVIGDRPSLRAAPRVRVVEYWRGPRGGAQAGGDSAALRAAVEDSVERQLRSDVPVCVLLSGGLDSTIIASISARRMPGLLTYSAGAEDGSANSDLVFARRAAEALGTRHAEARITRERFGERWPAMVRSTRLPMSTPNEVAIFEVARRLRADGCVVALSGEGADELFGGYDLALDAASAFIESARDPADIASAADFHLAMASWVPPDFKRGVLSDRAWREAEHDAWLVRAYDNEFALAADEAGNTGLEAHARMIRRINLTGLLQRLDSATMLAGVEGRTPFADHTIARFAETLPMDARFTSAAGGDGVREASRAAVASLPRTKLILREAFADLPAFVLERGKASFPLPFETWLADHAAALRESSFACDLFSPAAIDAVTSQPERLWRLAWPMMNLAYWGEAMGW